jgi:Mlc titration factor MtfA (ptsG expression regulator)
VSSESSDNATVLDWHQVAAGPFPPHWRPILLERVPFYRQLSDKERERFEDKVKVFVLTKTFSAAGKLSLTEEMKVVVAATACRLTMNQPWEHYPQIKHVSLRAEAFRGDSGGKAIGEGGRWSVTISWPDLLEGLAVTDDGHNVGYHEFAHALDGADDDLDGEAPGPASEVYLNWSEVMSAGRDAVRRALQAKVAPPIDGYAAKSDSEFFAVATEWFFERPRALRARMPAVYDLLSRFYRQDPPLEEEMEEPPAVAEEVPDDPGPPVIAIASPPTPPASPPTPPASPPTPPASRPAPHRTVHRMPVRIKDPREWAIRDVILLVGWICFLVAGILIFPRVGAGIGRSHNPGSDWLTALALTRGMGIAVLVMGGVGLVALLVGSLLPERDDGGPEG